MNAKPAPNRTQSPTIQEAKDLLERVVETQRREFVERLFGCRVELRQLIELVGAKAIGQDVINEVQELVKLTMPQGSTAREDLTDARITTEQKIDFIVSQLKQHAGSMEKKELLEKARQKFGHQRPASFLDPAIKAGPFKRCPSDKGNQKTVVLVDAS